MCYNNTQKNNTVCHKNQYVEWKWSASLEARAIWFFVHTNSPTNENAVIIYLMLFQACYFLSFRHKK